MSGMTKNIQGLDLSIYNQEYIEKIIHERIRETNCRNFEEYRGKCINDCHETEIVKNQIINNYSEFFRNSLTFAFLEKSLIPTLAAKKLKGRNPEIRIWSAACASGQEAYSIAMLCDEFTANHESRIRFRIFASDMIQSEVTKAKIGEFHRGAVENLSMARVMKYFSQKEDRFIVNNVLKDRIEFTVFDLLDDALDYPQGSVFGNFDIVFCSNVLFYYTPKIQKRILEKVDLSLAKNGFLIVDDAETEIVSFERRYTNFKYFPIFQKTVS